MAMRAAQDNGLAGNNGRMRAAGERFELIHHPRHHLGRGTTARRDHVAVAAKLRRNGANPAPRGAFLLGLGKFLHVADQTATGTAQREVHQCIAPSGPSRHRVAILEILIVVAMQPAAARAARVVVLDPVALKNFRPVIIHTDGHGEDKFPHGMAQKFSQIGIEIEKRHGLFKLTAERVRWIAVAHIFLLNHSAIGSKPRCVVGGARIMRRQTRCSWRTILRAPPYQAGRQFLAAIIVSSRSNC